MTRESDRANHRFADSIGGDASNYRRADGGASIKMRHYNITDHSKVTDPPPPKVFLTITADGRLIPGPGLSVDEATQKAAQMLVEHYGAEATQKAAQMLVEHCGAALAARGKISGV